MVLVIFSIPTISSIDQVKASNLFRNVFQNLQFYYSKKSVVLSFVLLSILVLLFTVSSAIGFLLLFVPGIIIALMFSQIFYITAENPQIDVIDAFKKSTSLMKNKKLQLFGLGMRYFGLFILGVFTLGIWWLWLIPQAYVSFAIFYKELQS